MPTSIQNPLSISGAAQTLAAQHPSYVFIIPATVRAWISDPTTVSLREITLAEEMSASQMASGGFGFAYECLKHAVVSADGQPITWDEAGKERFLEGCSPRVRNLLVKAFSKLHEPAKKEEEDFFAEMRVVV
jgi:hypothetical protein